MPIFKKDPMYLYLLLLTLSVTGGLQAWRTLFDNFAVDVIGLDGYHIGIIQSLREVPGFLALLVVYVLLVVKEHKLAAISVFILGLGVRLTGFFPSFYGLIFTTILMSFGFHYFETVNQALTLQYFSKTDSPIVFGLLRSRSAACSMAVAIFFLLFSNYLSFTTMYLGFGILIIIVALFALMQNPSRKNIPIQNKQMVFKKRYWLFYLLTFLSGARRQVFMAFAVFLLVKKFDYSVQEVACLFLFNNLVNYFLSPFIGRCIAKYGEHRVLSLEYIALVLIFTGYAVVEDRYIAALLYILDHIFFNFAIGIKTFFQKIADTKDISPSMAVGFTINHIAAVTLPVAGGLLWLVDYKIVFIAGALLSIASLVAVQYIPGQLNKHVADNN